jgi:hypothetical protein
MFFMNTKPLTPFPCTACGKCCRLVGNSEQTAFLDRGDGVCRHFDEQTNLCTIYETRPLVCRVEDYYRRYLSNKIKWDNFVQINVEICRKL